LTLEWVALECGKLDEAGTAAPHEVVNVDRLRCTVCYTPKRRGLEIEKARPTSDLHVVWGDTREAEATVHLLHSVPAQWRSGKFDRPSTPHASPSLIPHKESA
jgi:hypothetical protein